METDSAEIDFRSLEDELYDNEITQILTQPNTSEKSTLNTPELPADVDRLVDHLSVELKHAADKLFEVDPRGSSEREASSDEEGSSSKCNKTRDKFLSLEDLEDDKEDPINFNDDPSDALDKENSIRMGQLSVELKEAAEKLFAVDPLGSSEKDASSSDQEMSSSDSDVESDGESDPFSLNDEDHSQIKSDNSDDNVEENEAVVNSSSRNSSPDTVRSDFNSETKDFVNNCDKSSDLCNDAQWETVHNNELSNFEDDKQEETQDSIQKMDVEIADKIAKSSVSPCTKTNVENHVEDGDLDISSSSEFKLVITDVRSEHVDFHQGEKEAEEECEGESEHLPATEIGEAEPGINIPHNPNPATDSTSFCSSLINVEDNETSLVVENVYSLSDQQKENELDELPQKQDEDDICENNITSRSLRTRKVKDDVNKVNEPVHLKKKKRMKRASKENVKKCSERGTVKTESDNNIHKEYCNEDVPPLLSHDKDTKDIQVEDKQDCSQIPLKESEKMEAYTIQDGQYKCHFCSCILTTKSRFKMHMLSRHNKKYTCRYCDKKFLKCQDLAIHVKTRHSNELKYKVSKSGKVHSFEKDGRSKQKVRRKTPANKCTLTLSKGKGGINYTCRYCGEVFEKQQILACHIRNKHVLPNDSGKIVYNKTGKFAGRRFKEKATLKLKSKGSNRKIGSSVVHVPTVQDTRKGESSSNSDNENQKEDGIELPSKRPRRDTKAARAAESGLDRVAQLQEDYNIRISHQIFRCGYCPKWFFKKTDLSSHLQKHVDNQEKERKSKIEEEEDAETMGDWDSETTKEDGLQKSRVFCKYCTSQFKSLFKLQVHVVRHLGEVYKDDTSENKLECAFCGHIFPSITGSNIERTLRHLFDHFSSKQEDIDVDPYNLLECRYCGVPFLSNEKLRPHENEHRKFLDAKRRKQTRRKSVEEIISNVEQEGKSSEFERLKNSEFNEERSLETIAADDPVPFTCGMCSSRFPSSQYLLHHMTLHMKGKYVFRVEVDKNKSTQESPVKRLVQSPNKTVKPLTLKSTFTEKKPICTSDKLHLNQNQYISPIVQDRIQTMLRQSLSFKQQEANNDSVSPKKTIRQITKPQILKKSPIPCNSPTKDNRYNRTISVQTEINSSPKLHNHALTRQKPGTSHKLVSIISKQPNQIKSKESQILSLNPATPKKSDSESGKSKRKQTFNVSDLKEDFEPSGTNSSENASKTGKQKLTFTRDEETEGEIELPPVQCAEDLLDCSSTDTADADLSDSVTGVTETLKTGPSVKSKYKEVSSSESASSSDSASDFERDWKSRYNKKKKIGRKRKKKLARKRIPAAKVRPKRDHAKLENSQNTRGWKRKINFANGKWFECSLCLYKCTMEKDYLVHMKSHESIDWEERDLVECNICQRKFMSKWHLQNHRAQHRDNEYKCTYCGMDFATSSAIVTHINEVHESVV